MAGMSSWNIQEPESVAMEQAMSLIEGTEHSRNIVGLSIEFYRVSLISF
jgi:hypothetical protein